MKVKCPKCKKEVPWSGNPFRPFCSERCKLLDLGAWADGSNAVPGDHDPSSESAAPKIPTQNENLENEED